MLFLIREALGDSSNTNKKMYCSLENLKKTIEQRFSIIVSNAQLDKLIAFINQTEESNIKSGLVNWTEIFKKFSEIK